MFCRGNRTIEYIRGSRPEIDIAFGDDTFLARRMDGCLLANPTGIIIGSFGQVWGLLFHGEAFIGNSTSHDMITIAAKPQSTLFMFMKRHDILQKEPNLDFRSTSDPIYAKALVYIVEKRIDRHVPENEKSD